MTGVPIRRGQTQRDTQRIKPREEGDRKRGQEDVTTSVGDKLRLRCLWANKLQCPAKRNLELRRAVRL